MLLISSKWFYVVKFNLASAGTGVVGFLISRTSDIIQALAVSYIWILNGAPGYIITYLIIGRIYRSLSNVFESETIASEIESGRVVTYLLQPSPYILICFFRAIGKRLVLNFSQAGALLISAILFFSYLDLSFVNVRAMLLFIPFILISFVIGFLLEFMVGVSIIYFSDRRNYSGVKRAYGGIIGILSGIIIPLDRLPIYDNLIKFLPSSWFLHHPMQIFLGRYDTYGMIWTIVGGVLWITLLGIIAQLYFRLSLRKNEANGL